MSSAPLSASKNEPRVVNQSGPGSAGGDNPATSMKRGSYNYDRDRGGFPYEWSDLAEFEEWRRDEERAYSIELIASSSVSAAPGALWSRKRVYVLSCQLSGGKSKYEKKFPDRLRKIDSKKTGCKCRIVIKFYPHTSCILGRYSEEHDHEIGIANIQYIRLSHTGRERMRNLLKDKVDPREIVCN